jgi:hypothetical protein
MVSMARWVLVMLRGDGRKAGIGEVAAEKQFLPVEWMYLIAHSLSR